jgi:hypothetical protein
MVEITPNLLEKYTDDLARTELRGARAKNSALVDECLAGMCSDLARKAPARGHSR